MLKGKKMAYYVVPFRNQKPEDAHRFEKKAVALKFIASHFVFESELVALSAKMEIGADGEFQRAIFDSAAQVGSLKTKTGEHLIFFLEETETFVETEIERRLEGNPPLNLAAASLGKKGGSAKSGAKKLASRENGKKGGRPRKNPPKK